jgi:pseudaminic acid cytidylyltransferase
MKLAVIPARGGSKRIPRKNIRPFHGKPIIGWSIDAALKSGCFDRIIVSTDDEEIAEVACRLGAEAPFRRPAQLADDHTPTVPVVADAVRRMNDSGVHPELVCCIYPAAPMVRADALRRALEVMASPQWEYCVPVTSFPYAIQRALRRAPSGGVSLMNPETANVRSQDLEPAYHDAGQFYWGRASAWLAHSPVFGPRTASVLLPRHQVQDVDTEEDWSVAERLFTPP